MQNIAFSLCQLSLCHAPEPGHSCFSILQATKSSAEKFGLRARLSKCQFFQDSIEYLGHMIDKEGIHTLKRKVEALTNAKTPQNVEQLQSFLGMVNYYAKHILNLSTISAPLNRLRQKDIPWKWTEK